MKPNSPTPADQQPLNMTVHDLPMLKAEAKTSKASSRVKLVLLGLVCIAPVVASYLTYYVIRPDGRRNNGDLIDPQQPIPPLLAVALSGEQQNLQSLKGQWLLISTDGGACNPACQQNLYFARQLRESMGKDSDRVDRVWLVSDDAPINPSLDAALSKATVLRIPESQLKTWLQAGPGEALSAHLYLVDPLGNWMMRFPAHMDIQGAGKAKRDLERLLKASSFWDKAGRP